MAKNRPSNPSTPIDLTPSAPVKDFGGSANEELALRATVAQMNSAAQVIAGGASGDKADFNTQLALATSDSLLIGQSITPPEEKQVLPEPPMHRSPSAPVESEAPPRTPTPSRILLTGRSGVGISILTRGLQGATVVSVDDLILQMLRPEFPGTPDAALLPLADALRAWGNGIVNQKYQPTIQRMLFKQWVGEEDWGKPGYWLTKAYMKSEAITEGTRVIVGVATAEEFRKLVSSGYKHYHVMCSPQTYATRKAPPSAADAFAQALDGDVTKKISVQRVGPRLPVVWNDPVIASPSQRIMSLTQWLQEVTPDATPVENVDGLI